MMKMIKASRVPVLAGGVKARYDLCRREMKADECVGRRWSHWFFS